MECDEPLGPLQLEYQFAHEAFRPLATLLRERCGARLLKQINDRLGDSAYWDFDVAGHTLTLHYEVMIGTTLFNARPEGLGVLQSLRPLLDVAEHPILAEATAQP